MHRRDGQSVWIERVKRGTFPTGLDDEKKTLPHAQERW